MEVPTPLALLLVLTPVPLLCLKEVFFIRSGAQLGRVYVYSFKRNMWAKRARHVMSCPAMPCSVLSCHVMSCHLSLSISVSLSLYTYCIFMHMHTARYITYTDSSIAAFQSQICMIHHPQQTPVKKGLDARNNFVSCMFAHSEIVSVLLCSGVRWRLGSKWCAAWWGGKDGLLPKHACF